MNIPEGRVSQDNRNSLGIFLRAPQVHVFQRNGRGSCMNTRDLTSGVLLIPQFCPQRFERILGTVQFLEPVYHWSKSAAKHISEVSHWLQCIQFRAESRSRFFLRSYSFSWGEEAGNREILRLSRRTLENRKKLQRTERIDCAIAGRMDTLC